MEEAAGKRWWPGAGKEQVGRGDTEREKMAHRHSSLEGEEENREWGDGGKGGIKEWGRGRKKGRQTDVRHGSHHP